MSRESLGEIAYCTYRQSVGAMAIIWPPWDELEESIQGSWEAVANAVIAEYESVEGTKKEPKKPKCLNCCIQPARMLTAAGKSVKIFCSGQCAREYAIWYAESMFSWSTKTGWIIKNDHQDTRASGRAPSSSH